LHQHKYGAYLDEQAPCQQIYTHTPSLYLPAPLSQRLPEHDYDNRHHNNKKYSNIGCSDNTPDSHTNTWAMGNPTNSNTYFALYNSNTDIIRRDIRCDYQYAKTSPGVLLYVV
jgi:hypothetical protein